MRSADPAARSLAIRRARVRDAQGLVALARSVADEPEGWLLADGAAWNVRDERRFLRWARGSLDTAVLVAELEGALAGRITLVRDTHPASRHVASFGLMVAAWARRRGVGRALLAAAEDWAGQSGVEKLELHVFPHNEGAIALYERAGYVREGFRREHFARSGRRQDAILMAKRVTRGPGAGR